MDTDASGTVSLKELLDFLKAVSGDVDAREVMWGRTTNEAAPRLGSSTNDILFLTMFYQSDLIWRFAS